MNDTVAIPQGKSTFSIQKLGYATRTFASIVLTLGIGFTPNYVSAQQFGTPRNLTEFNTAAAEGGPSISADGLTIYFDSDRLGGLGNGDIWYATRPDICFPFGPSMNLTEVNSEVLDANPSISRDGLELYFARSIRPSDPQTYDIMVATRLDTVSPFEPPVTIYNRN